VSLSRGNFTERGVSDEHGVFNAQLGANGVYGTRIDVGGNNYYLGNLSASVSNGVVTINTNYYSPVLQLTVVAAVVGALGAAGAIVYRPRRLTGIFRKPK
jgi:hypothetical protein